MEHICQCGCGCSCKSGRRFRQYHNLSADGRQLRWTGSKYEYHYRLLMEKRLGRKLRPGEVVHHKNGNRNDDSAGNLELCSSHSEHITEHHSPNWLNVSCVICGKTHRNQVSIKYPTCSAGCRSLWQPPGRPVTTGAGKMRSLVCRQCAKPFRGKRSDDARFCSHACYAKSMADRPAKRNSVSRLVDFRGQSITVAELSRLSGVSYKTLHTRISLGWTPERAATHPVRDRGR